MLFEDAGFKVGGRGGKDIDPHVDGGGVRGVLVEFLWLLFFLFLIAFFSP